MGGRPPGDRKARGAFYTPPALGQLLAAITGLPRPGQSVYEPCAGTGGWSSPPYERCEQGRAPELVAWHLQDVDRLALALAGIQLAAHALPSSPIYAARPAAGTNQASRVETQ